MGLSQFLAGWWWALLLGIGVLAGLGWRARREEPIRYSADRVILNTPMIGRLLRDLHAARMARTLATMFASRLPLMEGLALTAQTVHNRVLKRASDEIVEAIRGGGSLSSALNRLPRSEEHTSELQSLMRISYAVFCLKKKKYE